MSNTPEEKMKHLDEMTLLLYIERQLDRARGLEVSAHTQECDACRTLLRALERESRLLTRALLEEEEPLPARLAVFFPALLFGWLRARTGGIGASVCLHAICNVYSQMLGRGYGVY